VGIADGADEWLVPPLLRALGREAPRMRLLCVPVQFRTVAEALASRRVDLAATVADELPKSIIVSYNADLRGVIEDVFGRQRRVRCSLATFWGLGAIVDGSALVATMPEIFALHVLRQRPHLKTAAVPFRFPETGMDLLWPAALDDDPACRFVRDSIATIVGGLRHDQTTRPVKQGTR
jgi:LysR family transcriptional activator of mexEF-oprN operon